MKKLALLVVAVFAISAINGCRASGDIDPHGAASIAAPR
jgi:hypothetical protein